MSKTFDDNGTDLKYLLGKIKSAFVMKTDVDSTPTSGSSNPVSSGAVRTALDGKVGKSGNETIGGKKTFSVSPSVPTPTNSNDVANKAYVDNHSGGGGAGAFFAEYDVTEIEDIIDAYDEGKIVLMTDPDSGITLQMTSYVADGVSLMSNNSEEVEDGEVEEAVDPDAPETGGDEVVEEEEPEAGGEVTEDDTIVIGFGGITATSDGYIKRCTIGDVSGWSTIKSVPISKLVYAESVSGSGVNPTLPYVKYEAQTLTSTDQAQARSNINAQEKIVAGSGITIGADGKTISASGGSSVELVDDLLHTDTDKALSAFVGKKIFDTFQMTSSQNGGGEEIGLDWQIGKKLTTTYNVTTADSGASVAFLDISQISGRLTFQGTAIGNGSYAFIAYSADGTMLFGKQVSGYGFNSYSYDTDVDDFTGVKYCGFQKSNTYSQTYASVVNYDLGIKYDSPISSIKKVQCWGDSLVRNGNIESAIASALGVSSDNVKNMGLSSDFSMHVRRRFVSYFTEQLNTNVYKGNDAADERVLYDVPSYETRIAELNNSFFVFWIGTNNLRCYERPSSSQYTTESSVFNALQPNYNNKFDQLYSKSFVSMMLDDIYQMTSIIPHGRFAIIVGHNGDADATQPNSDAKKLRERLLSMYPNNVIDLKTLLTSRGGLSMTLTASFTKPSLNGTCSIKTGTQLTTSGRYLCVGTKDCYDKYLVNSYSGGTYSCKLVESNTPFVEGDTISTSYIIASDLGRASVEMPTKVYLYEDILAYQNEDSPWTLRYNDNVHLTSDGYSYAGTFIASEIRKLVCRSK